MNFIVISYLVFLLLSALFFIGLKVFPLIKKEKVKPSLSLENLTIVIPFRNEANNLPPLLSSFYKQSILPPSVVFVNDHSEDNSVQLIESYLPHFPNSKLLSLEKESGKKAALQLGVQNANTKYILTLDADIVLPPKYFKKLSTSPVADLLSLPVLMKGTTVTEKIFALEYMFFNSFNYLVSSIYPMSVSGANLLFNQKAIPYKQNMKSHQHIASGDDYFLLKSAIKAKKDIAIITHPSLFVSTKAPISFNSYFNQRIRWLTKTTKSLDIKEALLGIFIGLYLLLGGMAIIVALLYSLWLKLFAILLVRYLVDLFIFNNYTKGVLRIKDLVLYLPFLPLFYPFFLMTTIFLSFIIRPVWKGRRI